MICREVTQKYRHHFESFTARPRQPGTVLSDHFHLFELVVSLWLSRSAPRILSVTGSIPPASSICIIKEVPERGSPERTVISSFIGITECVRPAMLLQRSCK